MRKKFEVYNYTQTFTSKPRRCKKAFCVETGTEHDKTLNSTKLSQSRNSIESSMQFRNKNLIYT